MRIWNNRRAVSGSISAMFVVLLFLLVASSLLSFRFAEDRYNSMVNDRAQRDWERYNERLVIPSALRKGTGTSATLDASIQNVGAVSAHLVTLFLSAYDAGKNPRWQLQYSISIWMGQGNTTYHFGQNKSGPPAYILIRPDQTSQPKSTVALPDDSLTYVVKVVTERGNIVTYMPNQGEELPQIVMSAGTMMIKYGSTGWKRPRILYSDLKSYATTSSPEASRLWIRANFTNNGEKAVTIKTGTIQFVTTWACPNNKQRSFGGSLYLSQPVIILYQGTPVLLEFKIDSETGSWPDEYALFVSGDQIAWASYAGFTSSKTDSEQDFFSSAVLVDAMCVYRYP